MLKILNLKVLNQLKNYIVGNMIINFIRCYGWYDGEPGFENKHDLAPNGSSTFLEEDSSSKLLFGDLFIVCMDDKKIYKDFTVSDYSLFYEEINEGFDDCLSEDDDDDGYDEEVFSEDNIGKIMIILMMRIAIMI